MHCSYFKTQQCLSCQWLSQPYSEQIAAKEAQMAEILRPFSPPSFTASACSIEQGFRNKAKMVVLGTAVQPFRGIINHRGKALSLCQCPLYPEDMQALLLALQDWLATTGLTPYDIKARSGELTYLLLNRTEQGDYMLRMVLRSTTQIPLIQTALPTLLGNHTQILAVSANIQPVAMAVFEGPEEHLLAGEPWLRQTLNGLPLYQRPKGFFQTNHTVAEQLYATASAWVADINLHLIWDLFCGSGGFGLHCLRDERHLVGIEIEAEAIACATRSAKELGVSHQVSFSALDSTAFAEANQQQPPDLLIVNPPRRGLGEQLSRRIAALAPQTILYSSCNAKSLAADLQQLGEYRIQAGQLFDMFPHTTHYELLLLLSRTEK
jgi:23S rRNA (uracil747-C5)-methyltransferase